MFYSGAIDASAKTEKLGFILQQLADNPSGYNSQSDSFEEVGYIIQRPVYSTSGKYSY